MKKKLGRWEKGIWTPTSTAVDKLGNKAIVYEKPYTDLQKYQKACDIYARQREIKLEVAKLLTEYRSIAQKLGEYLTNGPK